MRCKYNQILFGASDLEEFFQLAVVQLAVVQLFSCSVGSWQLGGMRYAECVMLNVECGILKFEILKY